MIEVLAPCGDINALRAAVKGGANAVYLGLANFNARMKADNFNNNNIAEWTRYCHIHNVKVYVTLNTNIKESEICELEEIIISCESAFVDAFIISDLAIVASVKKLAPHIQLHASTQIGVHNLPSAKFLERLGFSRVVLARECGIAEIKQIKDNTNLEIEYFAHGSMCVSFSGGCLFSSITTGNSGNRGRCLQPCRKEYTETLTGTKGYMLSPKDQCLTENVDKLISAGVSSLKIEGRMKSAEYVGLTCLNYAKLVRGETLTSLDHSQIKRVYNRGGFSSGYAFSAKNNIMCKTVQGHLGEYVGSVKSCEDFKGSDSYKIKVASNHNFINGDGIKIIRHGKEVGGMEVSIISSENNTYTIYSKRSYLVGDSVHITTDKTLSNAILTRQNPKIDITMTASFSSDKGIHITANVNNILVEYINTDSIELAKNAAMTCENITDALSKFGDTDFVLTDIDVKIDGHLFLPKSILNNARRDIIDKLYAAICIDNRVLIDYSNCITYKLISEKLSEKILINPFDIDITNFENKSVDFVIDILYYDEFTSKNPQIKEKLYVRLPKMAMTSDLQIIENILNQIPITVGIYAENIYALELAYNQNRKVIGGIGLNIFNSRHANILGLTSYICSVELATSDMVLLDNNDSIGAYMYGRLPVMSLSHCPIINITECNCTNCKYKSFTLKDGYGEYPIIREKIDKCYFTMYNSAVHNVKSDAILDKFCKLYDFTGTNKSETCDNNCDSTCKNSDNGVKYTEVHSHRGVE